MVSINSPIDLLILVFSPCRGNPPSLAQELVNYPSLTAGLGGGDSQPAISLTCLCLCTDPMSVLRISLLSGVVLILWGRGQHPTACPPLCVRLLSYWSLVVIWCSHSLGVHFPAVQIGENLWVFPPKTAHTSARVTSIVPCFAPFQGIKTPQCPPLFLS